MIEPSGSIYKDSSVAMSIHQQDVRTDMLRTGLYPNQEPQWTAGPVVADYSGDCRSDVTVFRPSSGNWYIQNSATGGGVVAVTGGAPGDVPVPAAYDGNGKTDIALFRPSTGTWYIQNSGGGTTVVVTWGRLDIPVE